MQPSTGRMPLAKQLSSKPSLAATGAPKRVLGETGMQGPEQLLSELGNLSMDLHSQWLDAFSACPIPSIVLSTTEDPHVLLVNSACVTTLGRDSSTLQSKTLADLIGSKQSTSCTKAAASGFEFIDSECSIQVGRAMQCSALFIPITDVCTSGPPQCYLMLLLDALAQPLCSGALGSVPSHTEVQTDASAPQIGWKTGLFSKFGGGNGDSSRDNYHQAVGIVSGFAEAAQRRLIGVSLGMSMPAQFDVGAWIAHFEKLLTQVSSQ